MNATDAMRKKTRLFMIAAFAVAAVAFIVIAAGGINKNLVYYWTPTDLHKAGDKAYGATIRLGGMVAAGVVHVKSNGVPPQMFRENIGVVVEGTMSRGGYFQCNRLMVSHNNEYRAPKAGHPMNRQELEKLMKSTEGLDKS